MKCTFCGEEYEFSFGHHCPVMQGESKQPMTQPDLVKCGCDEYPECTHVLYWYQGFKAGAETRSPAAQPDLVSKLREVIAELRKDFHPEVDPAVKNAVLDCADRFESLLGREGQAAAVSNQIQCASCGTTMLADGIPGQLYCPRCQPSPSTPIVPRDFRDAGYMPSTPDDPRFDGVVEELVEEFAILDGDIPALRRILSQIRKDALRAAEQVVKRWNYMACSDVDGLVAEIRALAERPAPAGEVKGEK